MLKLKAKRSTNQRSKQSNERLSARVSRAQNLQVQYQQQQQQSSRVESSLVLFLFLIWEGGRGLGSLNLFFLSFLFASFHSLLLPFCSSLALPAPCRSIGGGGCEGGSGCGGVYIQPTNQPTNHPPRNAMRFNAMQCNVYLFFLLDHPSSVFLTYVVTFFFFFFFFFFFESSGSSSRVGLLFALLLSSAQLSLASVHTQ